MTRASPTIASGSSCPVPRATRRGSSACCARPVPWRCVMRRSRLALLAALAGLGATGCDAYYNGIPGPDDLMHVVPWFDAMIKQPVVYPYQRADVPRTTVPGTVPVTGGEPDWTAEW